MKYVANRKGEVHFDPKRDLALALKNLRKRSNEIEFHLLDHGLLRIGHLGGPEYEVASMAQAVAQSEWSNSFISAAQEVAPKDFSGDPLELKFWTSINEGGEADYGEARRFYVGSSLRRDYISYLTRSEAYDWVEDRPEMASARQSCPEGRTIHFQRGILDATDFGIRFAQVVLEGEVDE